MITLKRTDDGKTPGISQYAGLGPDGRTVFEIYAHLDQPARRLAVLLLYASAMKVLPSFDAGAAWQAADRAVTEVFSGPDQKLVRARSALSLKVIVTNLSGDQELAVLAANLIAVLAAKFDGYLLPSDSTQVTQPSAA